MAEKLTEAGSGPSLTTAFMMVLPNALMWRAAYTGSGMKLVNTALQSPVGVFGLFAVPFVGLTMEKCFYDTSMALQGIDPNVQREDRKQEGYPAGGHMLPSLSLVPVKHVADYFRL